MLISYRKGVVPRPPLPPVKGSLFNSPIENKHQERMKGGNHFLFHNRATRQAGSKKYFQQAAFALQKQSFQQSFHP